MKRIKIIKMVNKVDYDSDESTQTLTHMSEGIDWHEVDDDKYKEIVDLIYFANMYRYQLKANYELKIIEEVLPETVEQYLEEAKALKLQIEEKKRKEAEKAEKIRIAREEKRKATEIERKRKQLEKLQQELAEG